MLENQIEHLTKAIRHLAESIQANTQAGNRIVQSLSPTPKENAVSATTSDAGSDPMLPSNSQPEIPPSSTTDTSSSTKRVRRTKAEIEASKAAIQAKLDEVEKEASTTPLFDRLTSNAREQGELNAEMAALDDPFAQADEADEPAKVYRISDVREAAIRLREAKGLVEGRLLLAKYDVETILDLPESKYADFIRDCRIA